MALLVGCPSACACTDGTFHPPDSLVMARYTVKLPFRTSEVETVGRDVFWAWLFAFVL
jgi:hypothetical protein